MQPSVCTDSHGCVIESYNRKNHTMAWVEKDHSDHLLSTPCYVQGHQPADQAAQSHIQPGLECLQGWGIHSLLGQPVQCITPCVIGIISTAPVLQAASQPLSSPAFPWPMGLPGTDRIPTGRSSLSKSTQRQRSAL